MRLGRPAQQALLRHPWPGNVRELRNAIERAVILETGTDVLPTSLPDFALEARLAASGTTTGPELDTDRPLEEALADYERRLISAALARHRNVGRTADALGISRHALRYRMQRLGLQSESGEDDSVSAER